ncbi:MAG: OmpA family protein [Bdellovibrionales bacterium]
MKKTTVLLPALAIAVMASAAVPAQAEVVREYPKQFCIEARCVTATHSLKAPVVEEPQVKAPIMIETVVTFQTNSEKLTPESKKQIKKLAVMLRSPAFQGKHVTVNGYTDNVGKPEANQRLSSHRALRVMQALIAHKVPASMLSAQGYGEADPVASNTTPEGRARNRRVTFSVVCPMEKK